MANYERDRTAQFGTAGRVADGAIDEGLRAYMLGVYNYMAIGLAITGIAALAIANLAVTNDPSQAAAQFRDGAYLTSLGYALYASPLKWVVMLAPLGIVFLFAAKVRSMSVPAAQTTFWAFAALMGVSISSIFLVYTSGSIVRVFFITAAAFGGLSLFGYTTKKDLSGWGSFLIMGLIGVIIAALVNLFLQSSALQFAISVIGVLVFAGLTAYDTQRIKEEYDPRLDGTAIGRMSIMGALSLYLNFLNMFLLLLSLFGNRE